MLTAWVSPAGATGSVEFRDGATPLGSAPLTGGAATLTVSSLSIGSHSITAIYSGDPDYVPATSSPIAHTVNKAPSSTSIASSLNPARRTQSIWFTATLSPGVATGTVQFFDGSSLLGSAALSGGTASVTVRLAAGTHSIAAVYLGDSLYLESTAPVLIQTVTK